MDAILSNEALEERVVAAQDAALARLRAKNFDGLIVEFVHDALARPRRPAVRVTPHFWDDVRVAQELEILRETRPSVFEALPLAPDSVYRPDLGAPKAVPAGARK